MSEHLERDLLAELFPDTARELFGSPGAVRPTLGLYPVADGKLALVVGDRLLELEPLEHKVARAAQCDLCHVTRSHGDVRYYRAQQGGRHYRYVSLCTTTQHCLGRAGSHGLSALATRLLDAESGSHSY